MGISQNPSIVRDGLVLHLDAANIKSYSGSGTSWTDITSSRINSTLVNGTSYQQSKNVFRSGIKFDGVGDWLTFPFDTNTSFGSGNFTIEMWIYPILNRSYSFLFMQQTSNVLTNNDIGIFLLYTSTNATLGICSGSSQYQISTNASIPLDQWTHIAAVRSGNDFKVYINGVGGNASTHAVTINNITGYNSIGRYQANSGEKDDSSFVGYMKDFRIVKGTAVYTGNFTPPTSLSAISGTSFLSMQNNQIIDNSSNSYNITINGNVGYTTEQVNEPACMIFDGSNDYVDVPFGAFPTGSQPRTMAAWFNASTISGGKELFAIGSNNGQGRRTALWLGSDNTIGVECVDTAVTTSNWPGILNWVYLAATLSTGDTTSDKFKIYVNGIQQSTISGTSVNINTDSTQCLIGTIAGAAGFNMFQGSVAAVQLYNRGLSASEIEQNFNAIRRRYRV